MVYKFVVLSDEDETFIREFDFLDSQTLMDFHSTLQEELEFDRSQIASFYLATDNWEKEEEFTLFDMGAGSTTMDDAILEDVIFRKSQKILYVFDFFNDRALFIEYVGEAEEDDDKDYPVCTSSKGLAPKQVTFGAVTRKKANNLVMTDDEEDEDLIDDEIFLDSSDEEGLTETEEEEDDFEDKPENLEEGEEDEDE